jgi:hypothetical protein
MTFGIEWVTKRIRCLAESICTDLRPEVGEAVVQAVGAGVGVAGVVVELADLVDRDREALVLEGVDRLREVLTVLPARRV